MIIDDILAKGFKLSGSRRMAEKYPDAVKVTEATDWDFYGPDTKENREFLESEGFRKVDAVMKNYWDNLLLDIYKKDNIEVLIRRRVDLYEKAFESISAEQYVNYLWKSAPHITNLNKPAFRQKVCSFFNALFFLVGLPLAEAAFPDYFQTDNQF